MADARLHPTARPRWLAGAVIALVVAGTWWAAWHETVERDRALVRLRLRSAVAQPYRVEPWTIWPVWLHRVKEGTMEALRYARPSLMVGGVCLAYLGFWGRPRARPAGPGRIAAALAAGFMVFTTLAQVRLLAVDPLWPSRWTHPAYRSLPSLFWGDIAEGAGTGLGEAIAFAWVVLAVTGRWRPPEDRVERLGRGLGWTWIGIGVALQTFEVFQIE